MTKREFNNLDKAYSPTDIESDLYAWWEEEGVFAPKGDGQPFSVVIPPPNVTGVLHMGHALNVTLQDFIVRYKRLNGFKVLWVPGTDHAGIATQNVVEKKLKEEGLTRHDCGRDAFVDRVWAWKQEYGGRITEQIRRLGASVDWTRERFTMDEGCAKAVLEHFVTLYKSGHIYRGKRIINWCPRCHTALSDIEVDFEDKAGKLWHIRYEGSDGTDVTVATTRPETMFGDTAVAVHPDDERYASLIGKTVRLPIANRDIPVVADAHVDKDFGTGAVKVTPAHDPNDYEIGERHGLEKMVVMDESGQMNDHVPKEYQGLDRYDCRKKLVAALDDAGALEKTEDHDHAVGQCYRCHTVIEPYLSNQWFVKMADLVKPAIEAVRSKSINIIPDRWEKLYFDWMENIRDWCISRQIWWGHRIPVWYCRGLDMDHCELGCKDPIVSLTTPDACPTCGSKDLVQDEDVLDTWFSSALWPFSTLGWPDSTDDLKAFYPTSLLVTGYDIMTFWVSRMITMGLHEMKESPFSTVYIHGLVRDKDGKKMSKSLGNAIDPLDVIEQYGSDALRFSLLSASTLGGQDIKFSEEKVESCRNFANKIWNATRYVLMTIEKQERVIDMSKSYPATQLMDRWIESAFQSTLHQFNKSVEIYNYAHTAELVWEFTWNQYCDWYIEAAKINPEESLPHVIKQLVNVLKLAHPSMPFITEKIWQVLKSHPKIKLDHEPDSISVSSWPDEQSSAIDAHVDKQVSALINCIREVRNIRKNANIPMSKPCQLVCIGESPQDIELLRAGDEIIKKMAKCDAITYSSTESDKPDQAVSGVVEGIQIFIPLDGLIDVEEERARLSKKKEQLETDLATHQSRLSNKNFTEKAPQRVVDGMREKQQLIQDELALLNQQLDAL